MSEADIVSAMLEAYKRALNPLRRYSLFIPVSLLSVVYQMNTQCVSIESTQSFMFGSLSEQLMLQSAGHFS